MDIYDFIYDHLIMPTVPRNGEVWSYCPAHNDGVADGRKTPPTSRGSRSLRLSRKTGLKCFAGCRFLDILAAFGLLEEWKSLNRGQDRAPVSRVQKNNRGELIEEYWYCTPDNKVVAIKGRFEQRHPDGTRSKTFSWKMPDADGWKGLSIEMDRLPLYRSERLAEHPDSPVYFVEGEKACNACWEAGLVAVCAGCGASGTPRIGREALEVLRGRQVLLWPDNDDVGKRYMNAVRSLLDDIAASISIVSVPVPPSGDAYDFFASGKTAAEIDTVPVEPWLVVNNNDSLTYIYPTPHGVIRMNLDGLDRTRNELNAVLGVEIDGMKRSYRQRINLISLSSRQTLVRELKEYFGNTIEWQSVLVDLAVAVDEWVKSRIKAFDIATIERPPRRDDLIPGLIPEGEASLFFGEGDSGKTYFALYLSLLLSCGGNFLESSAWLPQLPVLWVDYETRPDGWTVRNRLERIAGGIGLPLQEKMVFYLPGNGIPLWELADSIRNIITKEGIGFMVIDSALKACGGTVREEGMVGIYFSTLQKLSVTSLTLAHVAKADINENGKPDMPFGSVFWYNEPHGYIWYIERMNRHVSSSRQQIRLSNKKANEGRKPNDLLVSIEFDDPDGPVTFSRFEQAEQQQNRYRVVDRKALAAGERDEDV